MERTPSASRLSGTTAHGLQIVVTNRAALEATELGVELAAALIKLFPGRLDLVQTAPLIGNENTIQQLAAGQDPQLIRNSWRGPLERFRDTRQKYLLY